MDSGEIIACISICISVLALVISIYSVFFAPKAKNEKYQQKIINETELFDKEKQKAKEYLIKQNINSFSCRLLTNELYKDEKQNSLIHQICKQLEAEGFLSKYLSPYTGLWDNDSYDIN